MNDKDTVVRLSKAAGAYVGEDIWQYQFTDTQGNWVVVSKKPKHELIKELSERFKEVSVV